MTVMPFERRQGGQVEPASTVDSWTVVIAEVAKLASHIADTDFVPKGMRGKPAAVAAAILTGREMGIGPMTALQHISIINGKPGQSAELMRALVLAQGHEIRYIETGDTRCVIEGRRRGEQEWTRVTFTADQAKRQGIKLAEGSYGPEDKLVARATSRLCRRKFADCVAGMPYTLDELEGVPADEPVPVEAQPEPSGETPPVGVRTAQRRTRPRTTTTEPAAVATPPAETAAAGPPLPGEAGYDDDHAEPISQDQLTKLHTVFTEHGVSDRAEKLDIARRIVARPDLGSSTQLTKAEASTLIDTLEEAAHHPAGFSGFLAELLAATEAAWPDVTQPGTGGGS